MSYKIDEDQVHAAISVSPDRYASESSSHTVWNRSFDQLFKQNIPKYNGMDILLVNLDVETWMRLMNDPANAQYLDKKNIVEGKEKFLK